MNPGILQTEDDEKNLPVVSQNLEGSFLSKPNGAQISDDFEELRRLLIESEQEKITSLEDRVGDLDNKLANLPPVAASEVSDVLPGAIINRRKRDNYLTEAVFPTVEESIKLSIKRDSRVMANALFPVIGPAIRKAINEALSSMVQSLNQTLEYSFSPKGLRWRLEAMQTGKPFGEVVLLKTLLYRVEEVFLIHLETGLLLQHVSANIQQNQDADMVSGMLTAIQDFVSDSFHNTPEATLDTLQIGELYVWIDRSPQLLLASVIRGNAPVSLREIFHGAIEKIQSEQQTALRNFDGDSAPFLLSRPILEDCLYFKLGDEGSLQKSIFAPTNVLAGILGLVILIGGFFWIRDYWRWSNYVERLRSESGIVVTDAERGWLKHSIQGLRDPLSVSPESLLKDYNYDEGKVVSRWENYQALSPEFVLKRAKKLLNPPEGISLTIEDGVLVAKGNAPAEWFAEAEKLSRALPVSGFKIDGSLVENIKNEIEKEEIHFGTGAADLDPTEETKLNALASKFQTLSDLSKSNGKAVRIEIAGHTDDSGAGHLNSQLVNQRSQTVKAKLMRISSQIRENPSLLTISNQTQNRADRCVTFKIVLQ